MLDAFEDGILCVNGIVTAKVNNLIDKESLGLGLGLTVLGENLLFDLEQFS